MLALLGPSGCGKTTTLRMVAGLIEPSGGDVLIGGSSVLGQPAYRRNLGMLFQAYGLFPHLTVARNVAFGLEMRRIPKAEAATRVREALTLVRLDAFADRMPAQLSGGQQQRVALARALVYRPRVLLLDEPFGALDHQTRSLMQELLLSIWEQHRKTVLFVTHDIEEAVFMANRVLVMSARPGRFKSEVTVPFAHPRSYKIKTTAEFAALEEKLTEDIRGETIIAAQAGL